MFLLLTGIFKEKKMLLAVDIGNTNIVIGIYADNTWKHHWRIRTVQQKMPDEYRVLFRHFMHEAGLELDSPDQVVISSVVPPLTGGISRMLGEQTNNDPVIINHTINTGLSFAVDNPAEVGPDLIADAVAAYSQFNDACIIVDFGTATTLTAVSGKPEFLGVAIAPGMRLSAAALSGNTAQLPNIDISPPANCIGRNTPESIQSGIVLGNLSLVEGMIDRMRKEMGSEAKAIATGGLAPLMAPLTDYFSAIDPWLTLEGIRLIALKNPTG